MQVKHIAAGCCMSFCAPSDVPSGTFCCSKHLLTLVQLLSDSDAACTALCCAARCMLLSRCSVFYSSSLLLVAVASACDTSFDLQRFAAGGAVTSAGANASLHNL
jgi:hypothetical protein